MSPLPLPRLFFFLLFLLLFFLILLFLPVPSFRTDMLLTTMMTRMMTTMLITMTTTRMQLLHTLFGSYPDALAQHTLCRTIGSLQQDVRTMTDRDDRPVACRYLDTLALHLRG